jgi:hypothetical protein
MKNANIDDIFERIKNIKDLRTDVELANFLEVKKNTISSWKSRKRIPYERLFTMCDREKFNFTWVLTGEGNRYIKSTRDSDEIDISPDILEVLHNHPTIEKIVLMLGKMKDEDVLYVKELIEEKKFKPEELELRVKKLELAVLELQDSVKKGHNLPLSEHHNKEKTEES